MGDCRKRLIALRSAGAKRRAAKRRAPLIFADKNIAEQIFFEWKNVEGREAVGISDPEGA